MYDYKAEKSNKNLPSCCKPDLHPQQTKHEFGQIVFDSQFDSGNLEKVERNASLKNNHFNLWVCNDCKGTQKATNYRTWFYFSVTGVSADTTLTLSIMNLNFQNKMFREGMTPTYKSSVSNSWQRVKSNIAATMENNDNGLEITWAHKFDSVDEKVWFSFTYPFSYDDNDKMWQEYEEIYKNDANVYLHRCTLIRSKEDRKVELITISSQLNKLNQTEKEIPSLFTDQTRPALFKNKKYVFFSARVHPGETPSSHVFNGIIKLILDRDDPRAKALRDNFVFYCIPMINPDGVYRGHYRTDTSGQNLNRFYINPSLQEHPSVYSIKELILHLNETKRLHCYIDLHAHATKKGVFIYGNCLDLKDQLDTCLFPRLLSLNSPYFEYDSCNFTEKNMYCKDKGDGLSKEGAGRVALYKATKLNLCYTLECNYNTGTYTNKLYEYSYSQILLEKKDNDLYEQDVIVNGIDLQNLKTTTFYNVDMFQQVGEGICDSLLDYSSLHPHSRIPNTPYKTLGNMKMRMAFNLLKIQPFRFCQYLRKVFRFISINENIERVLKCLWIYLHTGIKNELQDNTKPLIQKIPTIATGDSKMNPLKRQATLQKKQITSDKQAGMTPVPSKQQRKYINASQERKNIVTQVSIKTVSQLLGNQTYDLENKNLIEIQIPTKQNSAKKRPLSQRQERPINNQFEDKLNRQYMDGDMPNTNNDENEDQSEGGGGEDNNSQEVEEGYEDLKMINQLKMNANSVKSVHKQQLYYSESNIGQDYTPSSTKIQKEQLKRFNMNSQRLDDSFSQSLNNNQLNDKLQFQDDQFIPAGKYAKQIEYSMPQLNLAEQYLIQQALPKRPTSKRLHHSYIRKNTTQQLQPLTYKPLTDLSNQYNQSEQNYLTNSNVNTSPPSYVNINCQENKEQLKFNAVKISESKPYISEFDDRFTKMKELQANYIQNLKQEEIQIRPKKLSTQQQQQSQQPFIKQTRIIIDTLSKNKQRSESQKTQAVNSKNQNTANRSKSRNTTRVLPKKKIN